jgi:hypothetical protein
MDRSSELNLDIIVDDLSGTEIAELLQTHRLCSA